MANQPSPALPASPSSSYPILCASFNQDASCFAIGTEDGFKVFNLHTGRLCYERVVGAFFIVEMHFNSSLLAIVGAGEQPSLSPRRLALFNSLSGMALRELNFLTSVLAVRLNKERLVVILQEKTYIYELKSLSILDTIDTVPNSKGLCAFSPSLDGSFLALPASTSEGSALLYNVMELQTHCEIHAHRSPLAAMALSSNGMYIATASEQGTMIRVHLVSDATKSYSFRRGTYPSTIFSLAFGPSRQLPDFLLATSSSGSTHVFPLGFTRSQRSSSLLASMMPNSHHVLHHAVPAGVRSCAVIQQMATASKPVAPISRHRAAVCIITYDGYFQEYFLSIDSQNHLSWRLERRFNLLTAVPDNASKP